MRDMEDMPRSGTSGEYLLHENILRERLRNMYNAFDSTANSRILIEKIPEKITAGEFSGDERRRQQMKMLCGWLQAISVLTKDDKIYKGMFLDPVRAAAHARLEMAIGEGHSTSIEALVFARNRYYDKVSGVPRTMMSVIAPSLQAAMTINVTSRGREDLHYGYHVFDHCQPMPLANRIHQTKGMVRQSIRKIKLSEFEYLYTALDDIRWLRRSLEMENFCEVPSTSTDEDRRLAAPFVTFGKVVMADGPSVRVQQLSRSKTVTMMAVNQTSVLSGSPPESFEGKTVRILGVQWYEPSGRQSAPPEHPAIYCIEADDDVGTLRIQEECGRVRLRGNVHTSEIPVDLLNVVTKSSYIRATEKSVSYTYRPSSNRVVSSFLNSHSKIRELRTLLKTNAVQLSEDQVIDRQKSGAEGLARLATSKKHGELGIALMGFVAQNDIYNEYGGKMVCKALEMTPERRRYSMSFLRHLGIMKGGEGDWSRTKKGKDVAPKVAWILASGIPPTDLPAVLSPDSLVDKCIPPSLALSMIQDGRLGRYKPGRTGSTVTETHWIKEGVPNKAEEEFYLLETYERLKCNVLSIMGSRNHPLGAAKIAELQCGGSRASAFTIDLLLDELSKTGKVRRNGDTWEYPVMMRVSDLFERSICETMDEDEVLKKINVATAPSRRAEINDAIDALVREGKVTPRGTGFVNSTYIKAKTSELKRDVIELFNHERAKLLSKSDVVKKIEGGTMWEPEIQALIDGLVRSGTIVQIDQGRFTHNSEIKSKEDGILHAKMKKAALNMFTGDDVEDADMIAALVRILNDNGMEGDEFDKSTRARGVLNDMEDKGQIWLNGSRYVKGGA